MAAEVEVPIPMQVELMAKVVKYDRNAAARMENGCKLLIVRRANDNASSSAAKQVKTEIGKLDDIAGEVVSISEHDFVDAKTLMKKCEDGGADIVLFTPGLSDAVPSIASAFSDTNLLTVSLLASDVNAGVVLGFALESSRPTIVVHLAQARRQSVDFSARLLAIAKVIE
jgi:phosphoserine phosphatase